MAEWTTDKPTQEGFYWAYNGREVKPVVVFWFDDSPHSAGLTVSIFGDSDWRYWLENFTHWMGPLPVPEMPSERGQS